MADGRGVRVLVSLHEQPPPTSPSVPPSDAASIGKRIVASVDASFGGGIDASIPESGIPESGGPESGGPASGGPTQTAFIELFRGVGAPAEKSAALSFVSV